MRKLFVLLVVTLVLSGCSSSKEYVAPTSQSVYYEVFLASFYDSDNDGVGDIQGLISKLDYIQYEVGASSLWLMPIHPSPTYHKYDVVDYCEIDETYGTLDDFKALMNELKERDMTLIMDLVLNHTSSQHPWFQESIQHQKNNTCEQSTYCDYYNFKNTLDTGYTKLSNHLYYESVFWSEMPDLNLDNPLVREEILDITQYWIDLGIDGFRLDATTHYYGENTEKNIEFLQWFNDNVRQQKEDIYIVGEAWTNETVILEMYASGIDSFFNFGFSGNDGTIMKKVNQQKGYELAQAIYNYNETLKSINPMAKDAVFLSNHDTGRSAGYITTLDYQKLVGSIYLLMPGNVFIYYGEEIGMKGSGIDENKRLAMPWGDLKGTTINPSGSDYRNEQPYTVNDSIKNSDSLLHHYNTVIQWRYTYPEIVTGDFKVIETDQKEVMALEYDSIFILHNLSEESLTIPWEHNDINSLQGKATYSNGELTMEGLSSVVIIK